MDFQNTSTSSIFLQMNKTWGNMPMLTLELSFRQHCWEMKILVNVYVQL